MSDKESAVAALDVAVKTCAAASKALSNMAYDSNKPQVKESIKGSSSEANELHDAPLAVLLKDFSSLLSLLYTSITKLALVLKPAGPAYSAALTPLRDLSAHTDSLASCACSINPTNHGRTLAKEVRWAADAVVSAVESLLSEFLIGESGAGDAYLLKTGAAHEAIELARSVSQSNREAVKRRWEADTVALNDCVKEISELIDDEEHDDPDVETFEGSDDFDDNNGWGELSSLSKDKRVKASKDELARLSSALNFLKFTHALHKRIAPSLGAPLPTGVVQPDILDELLSYSNALVTASDELISALYIPQEMDTLSRQLNTTEKSIRSIHMGLSNLGIASPPESGHATKQTASVHARNELMSVTAATSIRASPPKQDPPQRGGLPDEKSAKERKWFDTCLAQIAKSRLAVVSASPSMSS